MKDFRFFNEENIEIPIDFEYPYELGRNVSKEILLKFINSRSKKGLTWIFNNEKIIIRDKHSSIQGFPTKDFKYVVSVYLGLKGEFSPPKNAVIFNLDGSIHKVLEIPILLSKNILKLIEFNREQNPPYNLAGFEGGLHFGGFGWDKNEQGNYVNSMSIIYDREWWESRILNPETGVFKECIDSGRL